MNPIRKLSSPIFRPPSANNTKRHIAAKQTTRLIYIVHFVIQMLIVKDSMVLIHLAHTGTLEAACKAFRKVLIPESVYQEVNAGKESHGEDVGMVEQLVRSGSITISKARKDLIAKANAFNIQRGEAEAVALYWQEGADLLATDDDNVRRKKDALRIKTIGTPAILIRMVRDRFIEQETYLNAVRHLRKTAWFSSIVYDTMNAEVE